jgi:hypothetical protein
MSVGFRRHPSLSVSVSASVEVRACVRRRNLEGQGGRDAGFGRGRTRGGVAAR